MATKDIVSPSRTYVAICNKTNFDGHYFRKFTLPETLLATKELKENTARDAAFYFLNYLDGSACIDGCVTAEDFADMKEVE